MRHLGKLAEKEYQDQKLVDALGLRGSDVKPIRIAFGIWQHYSQKVCGRHPPI